MCACVRPGLLRRQWRGSGVQPSSSPPTLTRSRSLWTQSDSRRTGRWLQSRRTRTRTGVMSELWGEVSDYFREVKNSPFFPSAILSCRADLKGATPVPGPTIMTGVSFSLGNLRLPFFTHRGTDTSPATASSPTQLIIIASRVFFSQLMGFFFFYKCRRFTECRYVMAVGDMSFTEHLCNQNHGHVSTHFFWLSYRQCISTLPS